mmetsp:Transcript_54439/g.157431  ORF Transcript_54439/g.157431 Transcript_54439/m.157431 type:complete len:268 (-) Transcript_54439:157-960(-)
MERVVNCVIATRSERPLVTMDLGLNCGAPAHEGARCAISPTMHPEAEPPSLRHKQLPPSCRRLQQTAWRHDAQPTSQTCRRLHKTPLDAALQVHVLHRDPQKNLTTECANDEALAVLRPGKGFVEILNEELQHEVLRRIARHEEEVVRHPGKVALAATLLPTCHGEPVALQKHSVLAPGGDLHVNHATRRLGKVALAQPVPPASHRAPVASQKRCVAQPRRDLRVDHAILRLGQLALPVTIEPARQRAAVAAQKDGVVPPGGDLRVH